MNTKTLRSKLQLNVIFIQIKKIECSFRLEKVNNNIFLYYQIIRVIRTALLVCSYLSKFAPAGNLAVGTGDDRFSQ